MKVFASTVAIVIIFCIVYFLPKWVMCLVIAMTWTAIGNLSKRIDNEMDAVAQEVAKGSVLYDYWIKRGNRICINTICLFLQAAWSQTSG